MKIALLGGTGFIGTALAQMLTERGDKVVLLTRQDRAKPETLAPLLAGCDAVVNLAGAGIADARWTEARKKILVQSRIQTTRVLSMALQALPDAERPKTVLQGSAVGYYGGWPNARMAPLCHEYSPMGSGFLAWLCGEWEKAIQTEKLQSLGTRVCIMRIAPVLAHDGGMLRRFLPFFRAYLGGPIGSGQQPMPWMHRHDTVAAMLHLLDHPHLHGPFTLAAPERVSMRTFCHALGQALHRPSWLAVPAPLLRLALGDMAEEAILRGQIAPPELLLQSGFVPHHATLASAMTTIAAHLTMR